MEKQINVQIKTTLWKIATGYEVTEKEAVRGKDGREDKVRIRTRYVPPDLSALRTLMLMEDEVDTSDAG